MNYCLKDQRFEGFVEKAWEELQVMGWSAYVLKEKLKGVKLKLKIWNNEVFGDLRSKQNDLVQKINDLDKKDEELGLVEEEVVALKLLSKEFCSVLKLHESFLCQKSRSQWLKEGDQNTRYFHALINWHRRSNSIVGLMVDRVWEEIPKKVKEEVKQFFEKRFAAHN